MREMEPSESVQAIPILEGDRLFPTHEHVSITLSSTVPDYLGILHLHDFIEIVYILSGSADYTIGEKRARIKKGDLIIINYNIPHTFIGVKNEEDPFLAYDLAFKPDFLDRTLTQDQYFEDMHASYLLSSLLSASPEISPFIMLSGNGLDDFGRLYGSMYREFNDRHLGYDNILRANIIELIVKVYRKLSEIASLDRAESRAHLVDNVLEYIQGHLSHKLSLGDIANRIFLNRDYLNRLIKERTGLSFGGYLKQCRIRQACRYLTETEEKVEQILYLCGFQDPKFFYASFKKITGTTPAQYRAAHRK